MTIWYIKVENPIEDEKSEQIIRGDYSKALERAQLMKHDDEFMVTIAEVTQENYDWLYDEHFFNSKLDVANEILELIKW